MPRLGLGTYKSSEGPDVEGEVEYGLSIGYRLVDTAALYGNEDERRERSVRESGVPREDVFITTKLWNSDQGYESTLKAFDASLSRLGMDYVDLYLVHWPWPKRMRDTWRAMETAARVRPHPCDRRLQLPPAPPRRTRRVRDDDAGGQPVASSIRASSSLTFRPRAANAG